MAPLNHFLRTCDRNGKSYGGFQWDLAIGATNIAPDWEPVAACGKGLHGLLGGRGSECGCLNWSDDSIWVVFTSPFSIDLIDKHKVQEATICYAGSRQGATGYLMDLGYVGVHGSFAIADDNGTAISGYRGKSMAGINGRVASGNNGHLILRHTGGIKEGYIDGVKLRSNILYKLNEDNEFQATTPVTLSNGRSFS